MKKFIFIFVLTFLFVPSLLNAKEIEKKKRRPVSASIFTSEWLSSSNAWWEISGGTTSDSWRSKLEYEKIDANITSLGGTLQLSPELFILASYGNGKIKKGKVTDSDWITSQAYGLTNLKFSESISDGRGDTTIIELGGSFRLTKPKDQRKLNFYMGYFYYDDDITMTNTLQTLADDSACQPVLGTPTPCSWLYQKGDLIPGVNSTFDFQWEYLKIGVDGEIKKNKYGLYGGIYYLYLLDYTGKGFWNLRPFTFTHKADEGYGVEANVSASYNFNKSVKLISGYRYFQLKAEDGTDTTYSAGKFIGVASLDTVEAERKGPYFSLEMKF